MKEDKHIVRNKIAKKIECINIHMQKIEIYNNLCDTHTI